MRPFSQKLLFLLICMIFSLQTLADIADADLVKTKVPVMRTTSTGIAYMTGGIGEEEVAVMKPLAKKFTLNLLFSEGIVGRWVTDINVNIYDEASNLIFRKVGTKNMLYVNLPAGTYTILANNDGHKLRHKFNVAAGVNQRIILNWKDSLIEEDMPLDGEGN